MSEKIIQSFEALGEDAKHNRIDGLQERTVRALSVFSDNADVFSNKEMLHEVRMTLAFVFDKCFVAGSLSPDMKHHFEGFMRDITRDLKRAI